MATISKTDLVKCIQKSGVIAPEQLETWLKVFESGSDADSATKLATNLIRDQLLTKWQAKYLMTGRTRLDIGSYRLLERISRDSLGDRFLALHMSLARKVVIQVLPGELTKDKTRRTEFMQKATLAAKLDHPNLIHVYDIDREGGRFFLVTEHVEGSTLEDTPRTKLSNDDVARITNCALKGMTYAHQNEVVHGRITTKDLVITSDNEVKIQNLALSPLRQQIESNASGTAVEVTAQSDFAAIAKISNALLLEVSVSNKAAVDESLVALLKGLNPKDNESIQASIAAIDVWRTEHGSIVESEIESEFTGGFDNPIATTAVRPKKKKTEKPESKVEKEEIPTGYFARTWKQNPVAVIATAAVLSLMLIGGSVYGAMSLLGGTNEVANAAPKSKTDLNSGNVKITKTTTKKPAVKPDTTKRTIAPPDMTGFNERINNNGKVNTAANTAGNAKVDSQTDGGTPPPNANQPANPPVMENPVGTPPANGDVTQPGLAAKNDSPANDNTDSPPPAAGTPPTMPAITPAPIEDPIAEKIRGIGPATIIALHKNEIKTFKQVASMSPEQISAALKKVDFYPIKSLEHYKDWIVQAKKIIGDETPVSTTTAPDVATAPMAGMEQQTGDPNSPFSKFPRIVGLPALDSTQEKKLGQLVNKPQTYILAGELLCEAGYAKGKLLFELNRTKEDENKWLIGYKRRVKEDITNVAALRTDAEDSVFFQWLPEASENKYASALRNCFLKLKLGSEGEINTVITLREPIKFSDLRLTEENLQNRVLLEIPDLPMPETIIVEMAPLRVSGLDLRVISSLIEQNKPAGIQLKQSDANGFLWIQVAGNFRRDLQLQSNLMIRIEGQSQPVPNLKTLGEIAATLNQKANATFALYQQKKDIVAPQGKKGEYDDAKQELLKAANQAREDSDKMIQYAEILKKVLNQPIHVSVYSKLGKFPRVTLAVSDAELFEEEATKKGKKK
ncbi:MAG: protein kinase [Mariniblastus sp.]